MQARTGSTRLPGKVFYKFGDRTMLELILDRVKSVEKIDTVAVLTTNEKSDDPIEQFCRSKSVPYFRGSNEDVLSRFYFGAKFFMKPRVIIRVTSDCPFIDPKVIDEMLEYFYTSNLEYLANTVPPPGTYPDGLDVEIFTFDALEKAYFSARLPSEREHVTFYLWKTNKFNTERYDYSIDLSNLRLTVDYYEDYRLLKNLYEKLISVHPNYSLDSLNRFIIKNQIELPSPELRNSGWKISEMKDLKMDNSMMVINNNE